MIPLFVRFGLALGPRNGESVREIIGKVDTLEVVDAIDIGHAIKDGVAVACVWVAVIGVAYWWIRRAWCKAKVDQDGEEKEEKGEKDHAGSGYLVLRILDPPPYALV